MSILKGAKYLTIEEKLLENVKKDIKLSFKHSGEFEKVYVWITQRVL